MLRDGLRLKLLPPFRLLNRPPTGVGERPGDRERDAERGEMERRGDLE